MSCSGKGVSKAMSFPDHFSRNAHDYARYRPLYPAELFGYLATKAPSHEAAWDCATGNGQAAQGLATLFTTIVATDASQEMLREADGHAKTKIVYARSRAEKPPLRDRSIDLITVALALHWFDQGRFFDEVRRVLKPGGVLACWTYNLPRVDPAVDAVIRRLAEQVLNASWQPQIEQVKGRYDSVVFPDDFEPIAAPSFTLVECWDMHRFGRFVNTWSASDAYFRATGKDPLDAVRDELLAAWGESPDTPREVSWDLVLKVFRGIPS